MAKKSGTIHLSVTAFAGEKASLAQWESSHRDIHIKAEIEIPVDVDQNGLVLSAKLHKQIEVLQQGVQFMAESACFSAIARSYQSSGQSGKAFRDAAIDRHRRGLAIFHTGEPEQIETATTDPGARMKLTVTELEKRLAA